MTTEIKTLNRAEIDKAIASIQSRGAKLDKDVHVTGVSILAHIEQHREVSLMVKLFNALPKGSRRNALVAWAIQYGQVAVNMDKATAKDFPLVFDKSKATRLTEANANPWFNFKKEKAPADEFSFDDELAKFTAKIDAWVKAGKISANDPRVAAIRAQRMPSKASVLESQLASVA